MKKIILTSTILTLLLASCMKNVEKDESLIENKIANPNATTTRDLVVPVSFSYKTTNDVNFNITLLSNNNEPLKGVRVDIMDDIPENNGKIIATGITNKIGVLSIPYNISINLKEVIVNTDYIGLINNVIVPVNGTSVNLTLGGKNPMKVTTAESKNLIKSTQALGKAFNRLSYKLGSFSTGLNGGVPTYLMSVNENVTRQFLADVNSSLPEQSPVPTYYPQYLASNLERNLIIDGLSDVWITFVHEGAGIKNSLFYFVYDQNNVPTSASDIDSLIAIFPNSSYSGSGGGLVTGNKVFIGRFAAGKAIGFALAQNAWNGTNIRTSGTFFYTLRALNPESTSSAREHVAFLYDNPTQRFLIGFEDINRDQISCDHDFNDCVVFATANPAENINKTNVLTTTPASGSDNDNDGVLNSYDEYPNDANKAFNVSYPSASTFASVAFEDLWPSQGDYDMNDVVVNYQYKGVLNASNKMVEMSAKYKLRAAGGIFRNGFAVELPINKSTISSISGGNGIETDATKAILKVFSNSTSIIQNYNTLSGQTNQSTDTITMSLSFSTAQSITLSSFNPFIYVNETGKGRGHEIHLPDMAPTELATTATLGTFADNSNIATARFYKTKLNLPFALNIPESFAYPIEKNDIVTVHLKFAAWAQSGGTLFQDWYKNLSDYRTSSKIY